LVKKVLETFGSFLILVELLFGRISLSKMMTVVEALCILFQCNPQELLKIINIPERRKEAENFLARKTLICGYGPAKKIKCDAIAIQPSRRQPAYNGYLNLTVMQHFYAKHRILLKYPELPCIIENGGNKHKSFYPMESIEIQLFEDEFVF
jgi:hypothetical protein